MEQPPFRKYDLVQSTLAALLFIVILGMTFAPNSGLHYEIGLILLSGVFCVYTGLKKIHQARSHKRQIFWYKQPSLLYGFSLLVGALPWFLQEELIGNRIPNASTIHDILSLALLPVMLIPLLAAIYYFFRGKRRHPGQPERMGEATAQPKEAGEDEAGPCQEQTTM